MIDGFYNDYSYVVVLQEDEYGNPKETMEFATEEEAIEYFNYVED